MILALGLIDYKPALDVISEIVKENEPLDMITGAAAESFVRLTRKSLHDASPVLQLLKIGAYSVINGCLTPLGYDKMLPPEAEIRELIALGWNLHENVQRGLCDPRYGLVTACGGWDLALTQAFLKHCLETGDTPVQYVAKNALKEKYVKLR